MSEPQRIRYRFDLPDGSQTTLDFSFDSTDFRLSNAMPADAPEGFAEAEGFAALERSFEELKPPFRAWRIREKSPI